MAAESTCDKLIQMRLSMAARAYREQLESPRVREMGFDERLALIVDAEWDARRNNKRQRLLRAAGFPEPEANVEDVRYDPDRKLDRAQIMELSNCGWARQHRHVVLCGASGSGKTWLACALGVAACNAFLSVRYARLPELLDELCVKKDEEWAKLKKRYVKCDVLILDDWLLEPLEREQAREVLELVEARYRTGSLILCSQYAPTGWRERLGEQATAEAVVDRIIYRSTVIRIEGRESMRKRAEGPA